MGLLVFQTFGTFSTYGYIGLNIYNIFFNFVKFTGDAIRPSPTDLCTTPSNGHELAGKVVLADRGSCFFHAKALFAYQQGATALIVLSKFREEARGWRVTCPAKLGWSH